MIVFLTLLYVALLLLLVKLKIVPNTSLSKASPVVFFALMLIFFFIPMQWGAPTGDVRTITYSVQIVPNVAGEVLTVEAESNTPLKEGDVLFTIDPEPFEAVRANVQAQLALAELRLDQATQLAATAAGRVFDVQTAQTQVDSLKAQLRSAEYNIAETVVRAPSDGYVTNVALRPGARVTNLPFAQAMAFIDTSELLLGAQIPQIYARHIEPGMSAEVTFKYQPGQIYTATVESIIQVTTQGQLQLSGFAPQAMSTTPGPFFVKLKLDDAAVEKSLPAGAIGTVAIYTQNVQAAHVIRKVMIRMDAWMNYLVPF